MSARERRDAVRAAALEKAATLDASGVIVTAPGTSIRLEDAAPGSRIRTSTGVELRVEYVGVGSVAVTVVSGNADWRKGDRTTLARTAIVEVV